MKEKRMRERKKKRKKETTKNKKNKPKKERNNETKKERKTERKKERQKNRKTEVNIFGFGLLATCVNFTDIGYATTGANILLCKTAHAQRGETLLAKPI
jgi:hypothetical protein